MAEERRRLKELAEAEKEDKKRRKLETETKEGANGGGLKTSSSQLSLNSLFPEPNFDLPEELKKYTGDAKDTKAKEEFEKKQATERRKIEKARKGWLGDRIRAERAEEHRIKQAAEAEKAREAEREAAEEALAKAQEVLEERMEALALRRCALGSDRHHRQYWFFPKGAGLYVEEENSKKWGVLSSIEEVDALIASLDKRGIRELGLLRALEKKYDAMAAAFKRAQSGAARAKKWFVDEDLQREQTGGGTQGSFRYSARERRQAEFFDPGTGGTIGRSHSSKALAGSTSGGAGSSDVVRNNASLAAFFGPSELTAFVDAVGLMLDLRRKVADADVGGPGTGGSWQEWVQEVNAAAQGKMYSGAEGGAAAVAAPNAAALCSVLQGKALELEGALAAAMDVPDGSGSDSESGEESEDEEEERRGSTGRGTTPDDTDNGSPGEPGSRDGDNPLFDAVSPGFIPRKVSQEARALWRNNTERQKWITDVRMGRTASRLSYCLMVLEQNAEAFLGTLNKELKTRQASYAAAHKGGSHRPPLPPPPPGKKDDGKGNKRGYSEVEENARATRARV